MYPKSLLLSMYPGTYSVTINLVTATITVVRFQEAKVIILMFFYLPFSSTYFALPYPSVFYPCFRSHA